MTIRLSEAYTQGLIAGTNHYFALQRSPDAKPQVSLFDATAYLTRIEWERGFNDGFAQGSRNKTFDRNIYRLKAA
ncbi:MAG: hypothetical protein WAO76_18535 [Georgfuchsia sp.]